MASLKVVKETKHKFIFDTTQKLLPVMAVTAGSEKEARAILTAELGEALDQLEAADKADTENKGGAK
jgi:hypothetical protein